MRTAWRNGGVDGGVGRGRHQGVRNENGLKRNG